MTGATKMNMLSDEQLVKVAGIKDIEALDRLAQSLAGRKVLLVGAGDLAGKKWPWIMLLKRLGVEVYMADTKQKPVALDLLNDYIKEFFATEDRGAEQKLIDMGKKEPFDVLDISTWGDSHLAIALRFQDVARWIVDTKPVDTHLELLRTIHRHEMQKSSLFRRLLEQFLVHDHYGGRWVLGEAAQHMAEWHEKNGFITEIQIYILETKSVNSEVARIEALKDGICLDLMPHAFRVLGALMPTGGSWRVGNLTYTRRGLNLLVSGGAREQNIGCVIRGRVETFAAVSLKGEETIEINGQYGRSESFPFRCLIVTGKGVAASDGDDRDAKGVYVTFQTGKHLSIDLESQRMQTPDGNIILPPADVLHRGINLPLIELVKADLVKADIDKQLGPDVLGFFQTMETAYLGMELIAKARELPWLGNAYVEGDGCAELINKIPRDWWGEVPWQLRAVPQIQIGHVSGTTVVIP